MEQAADIILASASPRRRELLARAGYSFSVQPSDADESVPAGLSPAKAAAHIATQKARSVAAGAPAGALVIGADTIVVLGERIFGKPRDAQDAHRMLRELSGKAHEVITGVCLIRNGRVDAFAERTEVVFRDLLDAEIDAYIAGGEPMDKAGAYGIQGEGGALVDHIRGDFDNVVGLPVAALSARLEAAGIKPAGTPTSA